MGHIIHDTSNLVARLRRIKGQVEGVERSLETCAECTEILRQIAPVRGAMTGQTIEVHKEQLRSHIRRATNDT